MTSLIVQGVPASQTGVASGMNANIRTIGGALGSTIMAAIVTSSLEPSGLPQESGYTNGYLVLAIFGLGAVVAGLILPVLRRRRSPQPIAETPLDEVIVESPLFEAV
jgi:sugar phosphate permease